MVNLEDYIEIDVSERVRELAREYARNLGQLPGSIREGKGNFVGFIGKIIVANYLEVDLHVESKNYDLIYGGRRASVKSKEAKGCPDPWFEATVTKKGADKQDCEIYIFTRVSKDFKKAWILGWYPKWQFLEEAEEMPVGHIDITNGHVITEECYNMEISKLHPIEKRLIDV